MKMNTRGQMRMLSKYSKLGVVSLLLSLPLSMNGKQQFASGLDTTQELFVTNRMSSLWQNSENQENSFYFVVWMTDGSCLVYPFAEKPRVAHVDNHLLLTTTKEEVEFLDGKVKKFTLAKTGDEVLGVDEMSLKGDLQRVGEDLFFSGCLPDSQIRVYNAGGQQVAVGLVNGNGEARVSLQGKAAGTYIVKSESITCKILKK